MSDPGRDELIDARAERQRLVDGVALMGRAIEKLMDDRVRHLTELRQIAALTETGAMPGGGYDVYRIARDALREEDT